MSPCGAGAAATKALGETAGNLALDPGTWRGRRLWGRESGLLLFPDKVRSQAGGSGPQFSSREWRTSHEQGLEKRYKFGHLGERICGKLWRHEGWEV